MEEPLEIEIIKILRLGDNSASTVIRVKRYSNSNNSTLLIAFLGSKVISRNSTLSLNFSG